MNKVSIVAFALFAGSFAFGETYTWTGAAGDGEWTTPGNWVVGEAAVEASPGGADTAVFAANTAATVNFGELGLTLGTIDLTAKGLDVVFTASDGVEVIVTTLNLGTALSTTAGRTKITLDGVTMTAKNAVALNPGTFLKLGNAANLTASKFDMYMGAFYQPEARTELHNGSTLAVTTTSGDVMRINGASILLIDDSTVSCAGKFAVDGALNGKMSWGRIFFEGSHPLLKVSGEFVDAGSNTYRAFGADFFFSIPEGGFEEPPIQHLSTSLYFMHAVEASTPPNSRLQVLCDSPAVKSGEAFSQTLVSVAKAMDGTEAKTKTLVEGVAPADAPTGEIKMSEDKMSFVYTQHASAGIVTVASAPFKFEDVDYTPVVDLAEGDTHIFTAPEHPAISTDVTCMGYVIYDVDPVTLKRTKSGGGTGTTCNYTHGTGRREIEWQWEVPEVTIDTTGDDLQAAFDAYPCAKINLAAGNYTPTTGKGFIIKNAIWLEGVSDDPAAAKLKVTTGTNKGDAETYYALFVSNSLARVSKVLVTNNGTATGSSNGGVRIWKGAIDGCVITNCSAATSTGTRLDGGGGGIRMEGGAVRNTLVTDCVRSRYYGGGISMLSDDCRVENCRVINCRAAYGSGDYAGGIFALGGVIRNTLVADCQATTDGYGIYLGGRLVTVENCTVVNCSSPNGNTGAGVSFGNKRWNPQTSKYETSNPRSIGIVRNSIVWNCTSLGGEGDFSFITSNSGVIEQCDSVQPQDASDGNISEDPQFGEGYELDGFSGCVDSAGLLGWMDWTPDLAGNARIQGKGPDMGCFERAVSEDLECKFTFKTVEGGTDSALVHFDSEVVGDATGAVYTWTITDRAGNVLATTNGADCASVDIAITNAAFCTFRLDVVNGAGKPAFQLQPEALTVYASRVYVNINGSDTQPYATETSGAHSLIVAQEILANGGEMLIAPGEYELEGRYYFQEGKSAVVKSMEGPAVTIVRTKADAQDFADDDGYRCPAFQLSTAGARLEGVTVTGVCRGIIIENESAIVTNCIVSGIAGHDRRYLGTGVKLAAGTLTRSKVEDCSILTAESGSAGAVGLYQTGGLVDSCSFSGCRLTGYRSYDEGGIVRQDGGTIRNSLVADGSSECMSAVYVNGVMENCTIANNTNTCTTAERPNRVGLFIGPAGVVRNTVTALNVNTSLGETNICVEAGATIDHSVTSGDLKFKNVARSDYRLRVSSPAVNAGVKLEWMDGATDLMGNPRVKGGAPDAGCYENPYYGLMILLKGRE